MKQYNCKNCGAPIEHTYNHQCPYCKSILDFNEPKEDTVEFKIEDMVNIEFRDYEIVPFEDAIRLYFSGFKLEQPKIYEFNGEDTYVSKMEKYINPPKAGFCIQVSRIELEKYGISAIMHYLSNCNLRPKEFEKLEEQIKEKMWEWAWR